MLGRWQILLLLFSFSAGSDSFQPHRPKHTRLSLSFTISQSLLKLMSIKSVMPSNHLILCCPLLLLPSIFPSIRVFSNESALHIRWPKYWPLQHQSFQEQASFNSMVAVTIHSDSGAQENKICHYFHCFPIYLP